MAFWLFHHFAKSAGIGFWAQGAMPSSIICYCLGLTEVDPIKYGLHSVRFVNDELPKFRFEIEASRFDEFKKGAEELLQANAGDYDIPAIKAYLLKEDVKMGEQMRITYLTPCEYLSRKHERPVPENIDDELARYALFFPQTMDLYEAYVRNPSTFNRLIYQEQMLDILRLSISGKFVYLCLQNRGAIDGNLSFVSIYRDGFRVKMKYYKPRNRKKSTN